MNTLAFYILISACSVAALTVKTLMLPQSTPLVASIISTIYAVISAVSTLALTKQSSTLTVVLVSLTVNATIVPLTKFILTKLSKDKIWVFTATINATEQEIQNLHSELKDQDIHSLYLPIIEGARYKVELYSNTKAQSKVIKAKLHEMEANWYVVRQD